MILIMLNFGYYLNTASTFGVGMWPIIETRFEGFPALMQCLLTFGLIKSSDQCHFDRI